MEVAASTFKRLSVPEVNLLMSGIVTSPSPVSRMDRLSVDADVDADVDDDDTESISRHSPTGTVQAKRSHLHNHHHSHDQSVFTPLMTPVVGGGMVLLSASRTITESLTSLAAKTGRQLEGIWDELGYSPEDRAKEISDLIVQFRSICETKIAEEQQFTVTYREAIANTKKEIERVGAALKLNIDSLYPVGNFDPQPLLDELATLEASRDELRAIASSATIDLTDCLTYIVEAHNALGLDMDPSWKDIESDLTERRREKFHNKKAEMKGELSTRTAAVVQLVRDCQQVMDDLRMEPELDGTELDRRIAGSLVRSKDGSFIMASKFRSDTCVGISSKALEELTRKVASLHSEKRHRKETLQIMGAEIAVLWEKLRVPEEEQRVFTKSVQGLGTETIRQGEQELNRLHALKAEKIVNLITDARETIRVLWEQTNATEELRREFHAITVDDIDLFDDDLLEKHDDCITVLQARLDQMKPILRLIERREAVIQDRLVYEDLQKNPDRLKQRGEGATKQLMAEEKMAKRIKRDLPRLTESLVEAITKWKQVHNEEFLYKGEIYLDVMCHQEENWKAYKKNQNSQKIKKKQEEMSFADNRFLQSSTLHGKKRQPVKPLGDNGHNIAVPVSHQYNFQQATHADAKTRTQSHDITSSVSNDRRAPDRWLGEKRPSTRF